MPSIARADQELLGFVVGQEYTLSFDALASTPDGVTVSIGTAFQADDLLTITTNTFPLAESYSDTFIAPLATLWIGIQHVGDAAGLALFDNISVTGAAYAGSGGVWQTQTGLVNSTAPSERMCDNDYRELLRAKCVANTSSGTPLDVYNFVLDGHTHLQNPPGGTPSVTVVNAVGHCDVYLDEWAILTQGERHRINKHGPHPAGTTIDVVSWTLEFLPFIEHCASPAEWGITAATIDGDDSKALVSLATDFCFIPNTVWDGLSSADFAYGTWSWWYYKSSTWGSGSTYFMPIASAQAQPTGVGQDGYAVVVAANGTIYLREYANGVATSTHFTTAAGAITDDTWHKFTMTRTDAGLFSVYLDDVLLVAASGSNPVTDTTYTDSNYWVIQMHENDALGLCTLETDNNDIKLITYVPNE